VHIELLVLHIVHVVGAVLWGGTAMFLAFFLMPAMGMAGPAGAPVMSALVERRLFVIVPTSTFFTVSRPALAIMGRLQQQMASVGETERSAIMAQMNSVRAGAGAASKAIAALLTVATIAMAVARYMD